MQTLDNVVMTRDLYKEVSGMTPTGSGKVPPRSSLGREVFDPDVNNRDVVAVEVNKQAYTERLYAWIKLHKDPLLYAGLVWLLYEMITDR
jgi:hypothetical protein